MLATNLYVAACVGVLSFALYIAGISVMFSHTSELWISLAPSGKLLILSAALEIPALIIIGVSVLCFMAAMGSTVAGG